MGSFRSHQGNRSRFSGSRPGGNRPGARFGDSRGRPQMHDAVCQQCRKECQVPFRPTGTKPVFCSNCFKPGSEGKTHRNVDRSTDRNAGRRNAIAHISERSQGGISPDQFAMLNKKLDTILRTLEMLEIDTQGEDEDEVFGDDEDEDDDEDEVVVADDADDDEDEFDDDEDEDFDEEEQKPSF